MSPREIMVVGSLVLLMIVALAEAVVWLVKAIDREDEEDQREQQ